MRNPEISTALQAHTMHLSSRRLKPYKVSPWQHFVVPKDPTDPFLKLKASWIVRQVTHDFAQIPIDGPTFNLSMFKVGEI